MAAPRMSDRVVVSTPGPANVNPETGNPTPGPVTAVSTKAYLSQRPVADVGSQVELLATQHTTITLWTLIVPKGTLLTSESWVTDSAGSRYAVVGVPADRPKRRPRFRAAALRLISDMQ